MVEWAATESGVCAVGSDGTMAIEARDWRPCAPSCSLPYPVDAAVAGSARALRFPTTTARLPDGPVSSRLAVPEGEHLLSVDGDVETLVRFEGPATVDPSGSGLDVEFDDDSTVTFGFREERSVPETVTVPPTPAGVASLVSQAGSNLPDGPERSHPANRPHPPRVEFDTDAPPLPAPDSSLVFHVPDDLEYVLVAAPLAYYTGATLRVDDRETPLLEAPAIGFERPFGPLPAFATEVAAATRRVFHLDCLSRELPFEGSLDRALLDAVGLEAERVQEARPAVRYPTFLDVPFTDIDDRLPEWHLSTYVDANYENAASLPYLLDRLSLVYPAEASEMEASDLLESSLDDFFRGEVASVKPVSPDLGVGRAHAWLADGTPVDAFKTSTRAHENRFETVTTGETLTIDLVLNDSEMSDEQEAVVDVYRERAADLPVEVRVHESLTTGELASVFETPTDFVHYIGHCEVDGLECPDGYLAADDIEQSRARTFFLNACGSYHEGETLVEKGSVAGGVTLDKVLNEQAATVGTAFARLLVHGFDIERALTLARRRIMMGKDYAVVGDGTYALAPAVGDPAVVELEAGETGFDVSYTVASTRGAGRSYTDPLFAETNLYGTPTDATLQRQDLIRFLDSLSAPVVYEGDLEWSSALAAKLADDTETTDDRR